MNTLSIKYELFSGGVRRSFLLPAVFFFLALPGWSQVFDIFPPPSPLQRRDVVLPEGSGKKIVERACSVCHTYGMFLRVNFDRKDWEGAVNTMVGWGAPLKKEEIPMVIDYLATNYKYDTKRRGIVVPGKVEAKITEWDVPTPTSFPHDSIHSSRSGFTWFTETHGNALARFDPKTQEFKEYPLRRGSGPYTLAEDKEGNIFFTSWVGGFIGKFDPNTGHVKEYPIGKLIFHDIAIDQKGFVWFAVYNPMPPAYPDGSKIGRLDPRTGEVKLSDTPTRNVAPYGLVVNSKGIPYFTEQNSPRLGSVNPDTMEVKEYNLPNPKSGTKRLAVTPDDVVWYTDMARGYLGRFDPKTRKFTEWPSPSGPLSLPYGIATVGTIIWYVEAESNPNMLVRFDPKTEKFQSWPVKAGGGIKHVFAQSDGSLWITRSLTNGIAHVTINEK